MVGDLSVLETRIKSRENDLQNSKVVTNGLIVDKFIELLGYDKALKGINITNGETYDWEIGTPDEKRFIIKVFGYHSPLDCDIVSLLDKSEENGYNIVVLTDGEKLKIVSRDNTINIDNIYDNNSIKTLNMLSYSDWDKEKLTKGVTRLDVKKNLHDYILSTLNINGLNNSYTDILNDILNDPFWGMDTTEQSLHDEEIIKELEKVKTQNMELQLLIETKNKELDILKEEIHGFRDERIEISRQLLDTITDNPSMPRSYVGVVGTKMFQTQELEKFVGLSLQELYDIVDFNLLPIIFDGNVFRLKQPAFRGDLALNSNLYDIDLSGLTEEEVLTKLNGIFSNFKDVIFLSKTIGSKSVYFNDSEVAHEEENNESTVKCINIDVETLRRLIWEDILGDIVEVSYGDTVFKIKNNNEQDKLNDIISSFLSIAYLENKEKANLLQVYIALSVDNLKELNMNIGDAGNLRILNTGYYIKNDDDDRITLSVLISLFDLLKSKYDIDEYTLKFKVLIDNSEDTKKLLESNNISIDSYTEIEYKNDLLDIKEENEKRLDAVITISMIEDIYNITGSNYWRDLVSNIVGIRIGRYVNGVNKQSVNTTIKEVIETVLSKYDTDNMDNVIERINLSTMGLSGWKEAVIKKKADKMSEFHEVITIGDNEYYYDTLPIYVVIALLYSIVTCTEHKYLDLRVGIYYNRYKHIIENEHVFTNNPSQYLSNIMLLYFLKDKLIKVGGFKSE